MRLPARPAAPDLRDDDPSLDGVDWPKSIPFAAVHVIALATLLLTPFSWKLLGLALASYALRMFAVTAGYHRYFSHRTFRTGRVFQFVLAFLGGTATQKGALWWAAHHRDHHRYSDTPRDVHSPLQRGFWWSHVGWILARRYHATQLEKVKDLARYPELRWLDGWHVVPPIAYAAAMYLAGGVPALLWGYFVSTVLLWHGTFLVNSLAHVIGRRRYATPDGSRNSFIIALFTLGEGWHNNHHHYQSTTNQGWFWWEIDLTWYALRALAAVGVVRDLRTPPPEVRDSGRIGAAAPGARPVVDVPPVAAPEPTLGA
jgi:stearoyl-CoA desaturase (Delta-9 desaturase)